jgi:NitT/TauT family transport system substrate-binding protein
MKNCVFTLVLLVLALPAVAGEPLRIGTLLIEDSVPFYVAEQEGLYQAHDLAVELIPFLSALERDSALAAGAIDGAITDPVGSILFDRGRGAIQITSLALGLTPDEGVFAILAAPKSEIQDLEGLKNVDIAVSNGTIIEYVTDRMLESKGFAPGEIRKIEVKKMPIRMQMLLSSSVQAATLPEPLASIAAGKGARILITDASLDDSLSQTVIVFRTEVLDARGQEVARFFLAYRDSVEAINADPEKYRPLFAEKGRIPPFLAPTYPIPTYPLPAPFPKGLYDPVVNWLSAKGLAERVPYESMVATEFLHE